MEANEEPQAVLDVSRLPHSVVDHRSPIWWGNLLLLFIETTMFALMVGAYFYVRENFNVWPPPNVNSPFRALNPVPTLSLPLVQLALTTLSLAPMILADRSAWVRKRRRVEIAMVLTLLCCAVMIWLRFREFLSLNCRWDDNAYASIIWTILGLHLLHLFVAGCELLMLTAWLFIHGMDEKHARDVRVTAVYWYWIVATWWILFAVVFCSPRLWPLGHS
jgi:heme/copper-type cytochrome/quinol oxidase subunit 3